MAKLHKNKFCLNNGYVYRACNEMEEQHDGLSEKSAAENGTETVEFCVINCIQFELAGEANEDPSKAGRNSEKVQQMQRSGSRSRKDAISQASAIVCECMEEPWEGWKKGGGVDNTVDEQQQEDGQTDGDASTVDFCVMNCIQYEFPDKTLAGGNDKAFRKKPRPNPEIECECQHGKF